MLKVDVMYHDFLEDDAQKEKWLSKRPVCAYCGEHIQDESAIYFDDMNEWMCDECADDRRRFINDYQD